MELFIQFFDKFISSKVMSNLKLSQLDSSNLSQPKLYDPL